MKQHFDIFIQPDADTMRVQLASTGNPASLADDIELLEEYHRRLAKSESFRVKTNCYEDFLAGKQSLKEQLNEIPF